MARTPLPAAVVCRRHRWLFCREGSNDRPLVFIYYAKVSPADPSRGLLTRNAARRIAVGYREAAGLVAKVVEYANARESGGSHGLPH
jgi:hypothetical protein